MTLCLTRARRGISPSDTTCRRSQDHWPPCFWSLSLPSPQKDHGITTVRSYKLKRGSRVRVHVSKSSFGAARSESSDLLAVDREEHFDGYLRVDGAQRRARLATVVILVQQPAERAISSAPAETLGC